MKRLALAISANTRNNMNGVIGGVQPELPLDGLIFRTPARNPPSMALSAGLVPTPTIAERASPWGR
jgi:hypothetical protein